MAEMDVKAQIDAQEKTLARLLDWIGKADSKAQIVIGANIAMIGAVMALTPDDAKKNLWALGAVVCACLAPAISLFYCFAAAMPHMKAPKPSLIFFGEIAVNHKLCKTYDETVLSRTPEQYLDDLNTQCWVNANIASAKFRRIKRAWYLMFWGVVPWIIIVLWLYRNFESAPK